MENNHFKFLAAIMIFIFIFNLNPTSADSDSESDYVSINFLTASYSDLEGDGFEDDIAFKLKIKFSDMDDDDDEDGKRYSHEARRNSDRGNKNNKIFHFKLDLILPSGYTFSHHLTKLVISEEFIFDVTLYNHALEPGWYWGHITVIDNNYNPLSIDSIYFDPPGGSSGAAPTVG